MAKPLIDLHLHTYYSDGTFTPEQVAKAAEEMKIRILDMIESVSNGENKDLIIEFSKYYKLSPEEIILRAKSLKTNILHNYSYFSVTTIDTFFYSIILYDLLL